MPVKCVIPVIDDSGNYISILKQVATFYIHYYHYEGGLDMTFLNRYDGICLSGVNEYSIELYRKALPLWNGKNVILCGAEWNDYLDILPEHPQLTVRLLDFFSDESLAALTQDCHKVLQIKAFLPKNEDISRYKAGIMSYDEVMALTFMFSYVAHPGIKNPAKKFFLIDGYFQIEGIFGFWRKITIAANYAKAKGYEPGVMLVSSDENMHSDFPEDDIWGKFFQQPSQYSLDEILRSSYVALSPNMNTLNIMQHIMLEDSAGIELLWPNGLYNDSVRRYISERMEKFLPHPMLTLGVLLRGTDYKKTTLPGHCRHADTDMVIQKIKEVWHTWGNFKFIYLATEDEEICAEMKREFGSKLICTDQERYTTEKGQLLSDLHQEKETKDGFRLGAEYLCSLSLLSKCHSLIASGGCGGVSEAIRENAGNYKNIYIFDLGINPR